ncbi:PEP-CTERM sorting domain-containing protein [Rippkaea orientalis]|uniref:PEP-CTERM sorting domain-containing protein n=1 Tax=Rippkaea orientalis TaxID=2546366 RepID=UPI001F4BEE8D|nr:PEP-CTERM sorting domain-containing protein [Rippkaea orientalis]
MNTVASSASPGIVPGINWNNIAGASGNNIILSDDSGTATTTLLTFSAAGFFNGFSPTSTANPATNTLYTSGLFGSNIISEISLSLSGIPYSSYDLYVFASADTSANNQLSITDGNTTFYYASNGQFNSAATTLLQTTSTIPGSPTTGPGQYQLFAGLTGSSITLTTGGSLTNILSNNVFGFQIVSTTSTTIPEPSMIIGLLFLGGGLFAGSKRKNS